VKSYARQRIVLLQLCTHRALLRCTASYDMFSVDVAVRRNLTQRRSKQFQNKLGGIWVAGISAVW